MLSTYIKAGRIKSVDSAVDLYPAVHSMINNNAFNKEEIGNGAKCIGLKIKWKEITLLSVKLGMVIGACVPHLNMEYIRCQNIAEKDNETPKIINWRLMKMLQ